MNTSKDKNSVKRKAAIYARFSTDMQREESIDAQIRACKYYAQKEGLEIIKIYSDRAKSGTTVKGRKEFLQMIEDSEKNIFGTVLVHKLNRFGRDGLDTLSYKKQLERNNVSLVSVTEKLDNTPEGKLMLMVIAGMNEFYSANLSNEVMKGLKENAYNGKHTGGIAPLGYDIDPVSKKLVINDTETEAVKLIFQKYIDGEGYTEIIRTLNLRGYKTKKGCSFGKGSLYEILKNQKYTGTYTYNLSASKDHDGKYNRHRYKDEEQIIKIEDAIPQIISKADFEYVQKKMAERKHKSAKFKAKETYLLTGKIVCGKCGSSYTGCSRKSRPDHPQYISYRCSKKHGATNCSNTEIQRDILEKFVLSKLSEDIFNEEMMPKIIESYKSYIVSVDEKVSKYRQNINDRMTTIESEINNIVKVISSTGSTALVEKLNSLESEKSDLLRGLKDIEDEANKSIVNEKEIKANFKKARKLFIEGKLETNKKLIDRYVDKIEMYADHIDIYFNMGFSLPRDNEDSDSSIQNLLRVREQR